MGNKQKRPVLPSICAGGHHKIKTDRNRTKLPGIVSKIVKSLDEKDSPDHVGFPMIPSSDSVLEMIDLYLTLLMPGYFGDQSVDKSSVEFYLGNKVDRFYRILQEQIEKCLVHECDDPKSYCEDCNKTGSDTAIEILEKIPDLRKTLAGDIQSAYQGDPSAKNLEEIVFCYPGLYAVTIYRFAHELHRAHVPILPRMLTEHAHSRTGCDIHPGARIGEHFFIDHATGVVIGETSVIGDRVRIYQGVTLGGANFQKDENGILIRDLKRHPTVEDDCVIYAGAVILGGDTVVGRGSIIGGSVWLTHSIPPYTQVTLSSQEKRIVPLREEVEKNEAP
jgi:serine O-acetyltransferase